MQLATENNLNRWNWIVVNVNLMKSINKEEEGIECWGDECDWFYSNMCRTLSLKPRLEDAASNRKQPKGELIKIKLKEK